MKTHHNKRQTEEKYWHENFSDLEESIVFPWKRLKPKEDAKKYYESELDKSITNKIFSISKSNRLLNYILLLTTVKILVWKYTSKRRTVIFISTNGISNTFPVIDNLDSGQTCKSYLELVKNNVIKSLKQGQEYKSNKNSALSRIMVFYEDTATSSEKLMQADFNSSQVVFYFYEESSILRLRIIYGDNINETNIINLANCLKYVLEQMISDMNSHIKDLKLIDDKKSNKMTRWTVNQSEFDLLDEFRSIVRKYPDKTAICSTVDIESVLEQLNTEDDKVLFDQSQLEIICFQKTQYLFIKQLHPEETSESGSYFIKSHQNHCVIINQGLFEWLEYLQGRENLYFMHQLVVRENMQLFAKTMGNGSSNVYQSININRDCSFDEFLHFVKFLYQMKIIDITGKNPVNIISPKRQFMQKIGTLPSAADAVENTDIVLLGDTPGSPTVGLLYLASYLRRKGIKVKCRYNDKYLTKDDLEKNILDIMERYKPRFVGVSMKWFPHMYRAMEICKIIKLNFPSVITILGGDTASFFYDDLINFDFVDYIIRGDGEIPLLELCKGNKDAPNIVYKECDVTKYNPVSYVQDSSNSSDVYLSDISDILVSKYELLESTMFIYTHKGCDMNCIYCSGCKSMQNKIFNRKEIHYRDSQLVKKDIETVKDYVSAFMFDFDIKVDNLLDYCQGMWEEVDLSAHFCVIFSLELPSREIIEYTSRKFKYVRWNIDICSLSEEHRLRLAEKGIVKPQPTNAEIFAFLDICEEFRNIQVDINQIIGLPYFTEADIESSSKMFENILKCYSSFNDLNWGRLHAQPGAYITTHAQQYNMLSYADSFEKYYKYSNMNYWETNGYPSLKDYHYPYILYNDARLNADISNYYQVTIRQMEQHGKYIAKKKIVISELTYSELDARSSKIAMALHKRGISGTKTVALRLEEPIKLVTAIWGVIKSTAAYLVLDMADRPKRISYILKNSKADILICDQQEKYDTNIDALDFDTLLETTFESYEWGFRKDITDNAVYVMYTSGTSGTPKGIKIKRKGLNNFIKWRVEEYDYTPKDNTLQLLSSAFDAYGGNLYCSLLTGGTLYIVDSMHRKDPGYLANLLREYKISNFSAIPSLYQQILNMSFLNNLKNLRFIVLGGEKAKQSLISESREKTPQTILINEYGPTEATITTTRYIDMEPEKTDVIGTPIYNMGIYILNEDNNIMPEGVVGELCISGIGVAEGYLDLPELTYQKFQEDPFRNGERMYRTGDLALRNVEGNFQLITRMDRQVKISGYRVECGEIEVVMQNLQFIKEAVVLALRTESDMRQLVAFFTTYTENMEIRHLRDMMEEELPFYMIPSQFILLDSIPRLENGKVDRTTLSSYTDNSLQTYRPLTNFTDMENHLLRIWKKVLKSNAIGINDNFFDIGGNSILLMQVFEEIDQSYHGSITIMDLFAYPTVNLLAGYLEEKTGNHLLEDV